MTTTGTTAINASTYAAMTNMEKIAYDISILEDPATGAKDLKVAARRLNNSEKDAFEWCAAAILATGEVAQGSAHYNALIAIITDRQEELRIIEAFKASN